MSCDPASTLRWPAIPCATASSATAGGKNHTDRSSAISPAAKNARKYSRASTGPTFIFQLPAKTSGLTCPPAPPRPAAPCLPGRSEEHTSELQSPCNLVCRLLLEKKKVDAAWVMLGDQIGKAPL